MFKRTKQIDDLVDILGVDRVLAKMINDQINSAKISPRSSPIVTMYAGAISSMHLDESNMAKVENQSRITHPSVAEYVDTLPKDSFVENLRSAARYIEDKKLDHDAAFRLGMLVTRKAQLEDK